MNRRLFLAGLAAAGLVTACGRRGRPRIGLALGGGGARGLAHIPLLEVFDELEVRPHRIAGTSIGAIIGGLYASGRSGAEIRDLVGRLTVSENENWLGSLFSEDIRRWFDFIEVRLGKGGLLSTDAFLTFLGEQLGGNRFEDLIIPLQVVATDFWRHEQVVYSRGDLLPAIKASMAVPGLFPPVEYNDRVLVDGGLVNPVPYELLFDDCDFVIAIDVLGNHAPVRDEGPTYFETSFNSLQIMQEAIVREKLLRRPPDLYLKPALTEVRLLEFYKADAIFRQTEASRQELRNTLRRVSGR